MKLPFPEDLRKKYYKLLDEIFDSHFWSEGEKVMQFESSFSDFVSIPSLAVSGGGAALFALFSYAGVKDKDVIVPANTFWATVRAAKLAGANVVYADCNKEDLCLSFEDLRRKVTKNTKAVCVVHIGGHIAFEIEEIAAFCKERDIFLIEDCAHAHGAVYKGKAAGAFGLGGAYSFYATKTLPLGEGGMVCSHDPGFYEWLTWFRNYGKAVENGSLSYKIHDGFHFRMNEFTAALGIVQLSRLPDILEWKRNLAKRFDALFERRVFFPDDMISGYYKYIVFDYVLKEETGKVFAMRDLGSVIEGGDVCLPNSYWCASHHRCVPIWYGWEHSEKSVEQLKDILFG